MLEMTDIWLAKMTGETEDCVSVLAVHLDGAFLPGSPELDKFHHGCKDKTGF